MWRQGEKAGEQRTSYAGRLFGSRKITEHVPKRACAEKRRPVEELGYPAFGLFWRKRSVKLKSIRAVIHCY
jgi:hypothetical protein